MKSMPRSVNPEEHEDDGDARGHAPAREAVALEPLDRRVQREREEDRDQDPGEDLARDPQHLEQQDDPDRDPEQRKDRGRPKADNALLHRSGASRRRRTVTRLHEPFLALETAVFLDRPVKVLRDERVS